MKKMRKWMVVLAGVSLLAVGIVAVAGNGFGGSTEWTAPAGAAGDCGACEAGASADCTLNGRDADGDGVCNSEDPDWIRPADGTGYGERQGCGLRRSGARPLDGSGFGAGSAGGRGHSPGGGFARGGCS